MSKTFACCELFERIKEFINESQWNDRDKYQALEFLHKAALKITNKRIKEWVNSEPVWTADYDYFFCEKCKKWFEQQEELQIKLVDAEIEKEKSEGTFYSNPSTRKALIEAEQKANKWQKELEKDSLPFGKSPQE